MARRNLMGLPQPDPSLGKPDLQALMAQLGGSGPPPGPPGGGGSPDLGSIMAMMGGPPPSSMPRAPMVQPQIPDAEPDPADQQEGGDQQSELAQLFALIAKMLGGDDASPKRPPLGMGPARNAADAAE